MADNSSQINSKTKSTQTIQSSISMDLLHQSIDARNDYIIELLSSAHTVSKEKSGLYRNLIDAEKIIFRERSRNQVLTQILSVISRLAELTLANNGVGPVDYEIVEREHEFTSGNIISIFKINPCGTLSNEECYCYICEIQRGFSQVLTLSKFGFEKSATEQLRIEYGHVNNNGQVIKPTNLFQGDFCEISSDNYFGPQETFNFPSKISSYHHSLLQCTTQKINDSIREISWESEPIHHSTPKKASQTKSDKVLVHAQTSANPDLAAPYNNLSCLNEASQIIHDLFVSGTVESSDSDVNAAIAPMVDSTDSNDSNEFCIQATLGRTGRTSSRVSRTFLGFEIYIDDVINGSKA